jgi:hypothetical protein
MVVLFDSPYEPLVSTRLNLQDGGNYRSSLPVLEEFINSLLFDSFSRKPSPDIDAFVRQLSGDPRLFARIVLFSSRRPLKCPENNIFMDWITPVSEIHSRCKICGYYLPLSPTSPDAEMQIDHLMHQITTGSPIFNVRVNGQVTNYRFQTVEARYASAITHFCQSFGPLTPTSKLTASLLPALFGIDVRYIRFAGQTVLEERISITRLFRKSNDFIPVCLGLNPELIVPYFDRDGLKKFVNRLMYLYHENVLRALPGDSIDYTFSAIPKLQWLLRSLSRADGSPYRRYSDVETRFRYYCPKITYWNDCNEIVARGCPFDLTFYKLLGSPPIAVLDRFLDIEIFGITFEDLVEDSQLDMFLSKCRDDRFPEPRLAFEAIDAFFDKFLSPGELFAPLSTITAGGEEDVLPLDTPPLSRTDRIGSLPVKRLGIKPR